MLWKATSQSWEFSRNEVGIGVGGCTLLLPGK